MVKPHVGTVVANTCPDRSASSASDQLRRSVGKRDGTTVFWELTYQKQALRTRVKPQVPESKIWVESERFC